MGLFDDIGFGFFRWLFSKRCEEVRVVRVGNFCKVKVQGEDGVEGVCSRCRFGPGIDVQSQVVAAGLYQPPKVSPVSANACATGLFSSLLTRPLSLSFLPALSFSFL